MRVTTKDDLKRVNIRLTDEQHRWLTIYANELQLSRGQVVRMLLEQEREQEKADAGFPTSASQRRCRLTATSFKSC